LEIPCSENNTLLYTTLYITKEIPVMGTSPPSVMFRGDLIGPRLVSWNALLLHLAFVQLLQGSDEFSWNLIENGLFSVDSMYKALIQPTEPMVSCKMIWKMKIPLKTNVFAWYLRKGVILTKDNLAKRNWHGNKRCAFCHQEETIKHLFFISTLLDLYGQSSK
jgi:hypothetical protein